MTTTFDGTTRDLVDDIIRYEDGSMDETEAVDFFSHLVKSGLINSLQGSYQRGAAALISAGYLSPEGDVIVELA